MRPSTAAMRRPRGSGDVRGCAFMISGDLLAPRIGGLTVWCFAGDQQFAQHMKIASQHTQTDIALKSLFSPVAATFQSVARLQGANCRFDTGMRLPRVAELDAGRLFLLGRLLAPRHRHTRMFEDLGQLVLDLRAVKATVERPTADLAPVTLLGRARLLHNHVAVALVAGQYMMVRDEACSILKDQHQPSKLYRLGRLAALIQLRVRLEDAEQLLVVGNRLALEHPPPRQVADVSRSLEVGFQVLVQRQGLRTAVPAVFSRRFAERFGPRQNLVRQLQQFAVGLLHPPLIATALARGDALDRSHQLSHLAVQVLVLPPADQAEQPGQRRGQAEHLPQAVRDQAAVRGIMDVGLDHKGIATHRLRGLRFQAVPLPDDGLTDLLDRSGTQQVEIAFDPPPVESFLVFLLALPVANSHDLTQSAVVLGEILELIVVVTASQPGPSEDQDLPVAQTRAAKRGLRPAVDIAGDSPENSITHLGSAIDVLQQLIFNNP